MQSKWRNDDGEPRECSVIEGDACCLKQDIRANYWVVSKIMQMFVIFVLIVNGDVMAKNNNERDNSMFLNRFIHFCKFPPFVILIILTMEMAKKPYTYKCNKCYHEIDGTCYKTLNYHGCLTSRSCLHLYCVTDGWEING